MFIAKFITTSKIFVWGIFKMVVNQTTRSRLEQKSVIKSFLADKYKPCGIYPRIYRAAYFSRKIFTNWLNMVLPRLASVEKIVDGVETH